MKNIKAQKMTVALATTFVLVASFQVMTEDSCEIEKNTFCFFVAIDFGRNQTLFQSTCGKLR